MPYGEYGMKAIRITAPMDDDDRELETKKFFKNLFSKASAGQARSSDDEAVPYPGFELFDRLNGER